MTKAPWFRIAEVFKGETEIPGAMHNEKIVEMFRLIGHPEMDDDETPWCAAAVGACLSLAGFQNTKSALARSYEHFGRDLGNNPVEGCIVVFWRVSRASGKGHVGFYAGEKDGKILVLGGNQKNEFRISPYSKEQLLGYRWPVRTAKLSQTSLPTILEIAPDLAPPHLSSTPSDHFAPSPANDGATAVHNIAEPFRASVALSAKFQRCHKIIAKWEGGYADHPSDPGGATNFGITHRVLREWRGRPVSKADVRSLSYDEALEIFASRYWQVIEGEELPSAAALMTYNAAVNSGPTRGARFLQKALNRQGLDVDVDGEIGPQTIGATLQASQIQIVRDYAEIYGDFYASLSTFPTFGRGWMNRLNDVKAEAANWAVQEPIFRAADDPAATLPSHSAAGREDGAVREEDLTVIDKMMGGRRLAGKKTLIATALYLALLVAEGAGFLPSGFVRQTVTPPTQNATPPSNATGENTPQPTQPQPQPSQPQPMQPSQPQPAAPASPGAPSPLDIIQQVLLGLAGLSALSKVERGLKIVRHISPIIRRRR